MVKTGLRNTSCVLFIYRCSLYTPSGYFQGHDFFLVRKSSYRFLTIRSNHFESSLPAYSQVVPSIRDHHFHLFLISWMTLVQIANTFDMIYIVQPAFLYTHWFLIHVLACQKLSQGMITEVVPAFFLFLCPRVWSQYECFLGQCAVCLVYQPLIKLCQDLCMCLSLSHFIPQSNNIMLCLAFAAILRYIHHHVYRKCKQRYYIWRQ